MPIVEFREEPIPFFVMPYFELGNLEELHKKRPITMEETVHLLYQVLRALEYLHSRHVAHRDLKPQNVLAESRSPFRIKVADFGFANDNSVLVTPCGTRAYKAPELCQDVDRYTVLVDLWSLGVMVLRYSHGLPQTVNETRGNFRNERSVATEGGLPWCNRIVGHAEQLESNELTELLTVGMLHINPAERLCAGCCLTKGSAIGLFGRLSSGSEGATTTRQTVP